MQKPLLLLFVLLSGSITISMAQDEGIGTFSQLVNRALSSPTENETPPPTNPFSPYQQNNPLALMALNVSPASAVPAPQPEQTFSSFKVHAEYDYRFNHQDPIGGLNTDINESHFGFSFASVWKTNFDFEYFHIWSDGHNGLSSQIADANGGKFTFKKDITPSLSLSLPFAFTDTDTTASTAKYSGRDYSADKYAFNPFLLYDFPTINKNLLPSLAAGYRLTSNNQSYTNVMLPDSSNSNGVFFLLGRTDYTVATGVSLFGDVTWSHYTNESVMPGAHIPHDSSYAFGAGLDFNATERLKCEVAYQYDGLNHDYYQHSLTVSGSYAF